MSIVLNAPNQAEWHKSGYIWRIGWRNWRHDSSDEREALCDEPNQENEVNKKTQAGSPAPTSCSAADGPQRPHNASRSTAEPSTRFRRELMLATKWIREIMRRDGIKELTISRSGKTVRFVGKHEVKIVLKVIQPDDHDVV